MCLALRGNGCSDSRSSDKLRPYANHIRMVLVFQFHVKVVNIARLNAQYKWHRLSRNELGHVSKL